MRALPLVALLVVGCPGSTDTPDPDRATIPIPDFGPIVDRAVVDLYPPTGDLGGDLGDGPAPPPDGLAIVDAQGSSCSSQGVSFKLNTTMTACQTASVTVTAPTTYSWVMVGITSTSTTNAKWSAQATNVGCDPTCHWTFANAAVPCDPGPYSLSLMKDATNDDWTKGTIVSTCTP